MAAVIYSTDVDAAFENDPAATPYNNAWKQAMASAVNAAIGDWTPITFNAGAFGANVGSWTVQAGDVTRNQYQIINKTLLWIVTLATTSVSSTPSALLMQIPSGTFETTGQYARASYALDNGVYREVMLQPQSASVLGLIRSDGGSWNVATDNTYIRFNAFFRLA